MSIISEQGALQLFPSTLECLFSLSCLVESSRHLPSTKVIHRHPVSRNKKNKTKTKTKTKQNKKNKTKQNKKQTKIDRKSTRLNSSNEWIYRMPSSA